MNGKIGLRAPGSCVLAMALVLGQPAAADDELELYGHVQTDLLFDLQRVNPIWIGTFRPSQIPTTPGEFGSDGQTSFSVRQSRLGVRGKGELADRPYEVNFEFDLFGVGENAGQTTLRLRHAYARWGPVIVGQTTSLFTDLSVSPNTLDYGGAAGNASLRHPQLRVTFLDAKGWRAAVAIEQPDDVLDPGEVRLIAPELATNLVPDNKLPDLGVQVRRESGKGHFQLSGVVRRLGFATRDDPDGPSGAEFGWGVNASGSLILHPKATFKMSVLYGKGIGTYLNDGAPDIGPTAALIPLSEPQPNRRGFPFENLLIDSAAVPLLGLSGFGEMRWSDHFASTFGYSQYRIFNTDFQTPAAMRLGQYAMANLRWMPTPQIMTGVEYLWGRREDLSGDSGVNNRIQFSLRYAFNTGNLLRSN
ncbi:MAG: DcaP family trimeric outer membrane transporter [Erythrobacter sp.]